MRVGEVVVQVDVGGLLEGKVRLLQASVVGSEVCFEGGLMDNNLQVFFFFFFFGWVFIYEIFIFSF